MAETAARLVDQIIPRVPVREWVLSFPIPLRILFAAPRGAHAAATHRTPGHHRFLAQADEA
jgi:hypothetical protein